MPGKQLDDQVQDDFMRQKQVLFIRHSESESHIGKAASHIEVVGLTENGKLQARHIAAEFSSEPDLLIISPYLRAWQTAEPTMKRFPGVPHEIWQEVKEFTYLGSLTGQYLTMAERRDMVRAFWERCDPQHCDGNAESFSAFITRARKALRKLTKELEEKQFIVVFTHEQFIRAIQCLLLRWKEDAEYEPECMKHFRKMLLEYPLAYGYKDEESWQLHQAQQLHATPLEILRPELLRFPAHLAAR